VEYFNYSGSMGNIYEARCTRENKSRISVLKATFSKKNILFASKLDLNLRKKLVMCYGWSIRF